MKPYLEKTTQNNHRRLVNISISCSLTIIELFKVSLSGKAPQVYNVVLVVAPVQMHVIGIDQQEAKQDQQDLEGAFTAIHKVSVEDVRLLGGREAVLSGQQCGCWWQQDELAMCCFSWLPYKRSAAGLQGVRANLLSGKKFMSVFTSSQIIWHSSL